MRASEALETVQATPGLAIPWRRIWTGLAGVAVAVVVMALLSDRPEWAVIWLFGLAFGFVLQRARFCFASAFRDLFLFQSGRVMKGVLAGMAVASVGFALAMWNLSPTILPGRYPPDANILPLGFHTLFAGFIFAVGMTLAGGCISGTLYRIGEGYVASIVAGVGMLLGFLFLGHTWSFWWDFSYTRSITVWFPHFAGWLGGIALTLALILVAYLALLWWESRAGPTFEWREEEPPAPPGFTGRVVSALRTFFVKAWPVALAGVVLGVLNSFFFLYHHPWGVTGAFYQWMDSIARPLGISPGPLKGLSGIGGACNIGGGGGRDTFLGMAHDSLINLGMILGSFIAAGFAGEFKLRLPRQKRRYVQSLAGGVLMGYGAGLALGCTLGAFFSAVPSLALNGWGFALGLLAGSYVGVKVLRRIG